MGKRNKSVEQQCADLNAAIVRNAKLSKQPVGHRLCGCDIAETPAGFEVRKNGALVGVGATRRDAQIIALDAR